MLLYRNALGLPKLRVLFVDEQESLLFTNDDINNIICDPYPSVIHRYPNGIEKNKEEIVEIEFLDGWDLTYIPKYFLSGATNLIYGFTIPDSVKSIMGNFMYGCTSFNASIKVSSNSQVTSIGDNYCGNCSSLLYETYVMPFYKTLKTIGNFYLVNCKSLKYGINGYSFLYLTTVGTNAYVNCENLLAIYMITSNQLSVASQRLIGIRFAYNCKSLREVYFTNMTKSNFYIDSNMSSFGTDDQNAKCYVNGITAYFSGTSNRNIITEAFPNSTSTPYRKWK